MSQSPKRILLAISLAVLASVGLTSCAAEEAGGGEPAITPVQVSDLKSLKLPMDQYRMTLEEQQRERHASLILMAACMKRFGFDVSTAWQSGQPPVKGYERRYGIFDEAEASLTGYHVTRSPADKPKPGPPLSAAAQSVAMGTAKKTESGQAVPEGGCQGEAARKLADGAPKVENDRLADMLESTAYFRAQQDSRWHGVDKAWSECMARAGHQYPEPFAPNNAFTREEIEPNEISVAVADVKCKKEVDLINIKVAIESAYHRVEVEKNAAQLADLRKLFDTRVKKTSEVLAAG